MGLTYAALTTYWDEVFGYDNHFAHGLGVGLAGILLPIFGGVSWLGFGIQVVVITVFMGLISILSTDADVEEYGRGSSVLWTQPLMLI